MNKLDELLMLKSLQFKRSLSNSDLLEHILATDQETTVKATKNVCAHLPIPLVDRLESALGILNIGKREFIQEAIIDALNRFDKIADDLDIFGEEQRIDALIAEVGHVQVSEQGGVQ